MIMDDLPCGASVYNPDKTDRIIIDCEIILSESAILELKRLVGDNEMYLYISVMGGGCSGYIYELDLEKTEPSEHHQTITQDGISVAIQNGDSAMLNGLVLDYEGKLMGGGFKMINPNATATCGCGLSFK
jgi:iron-sulfur cluster assembly protein